MTNNLNKNKRSSQFQKIALLIFLDLLFIASAHFLALWLRYDFRFQAIPHEYLRTFLVYTAIWCASAILIFILCGLYSSIWVYVSTNEFFRVLIAYILLGILTVLHVLFGPKGMPRSFYAIGGVFSFFFTLAIRFSYRLLYSFRQHFTHLLREHNSDNVMIIGAGEAGRVLITEFNENEHSKSNIVCAIDDNPSKVGRRIYGVPIAGSRYDIPDKVKEYNIKKIIFAIPSCSPADRKSILDICATTGCKVQILPGIYQLVNGEASVSKLRDVDPQDLLGRAPITVNNGEIVSNLAGKVLLVTGGGGSIGSELCRQIAAAKPKKLIIFDIYENNAYNIQMELEKKFPELDLEVLIGSVRNTSRINSVMRTYRPDIVFHAAAHKHVPLMEDSPNEAIKNNVIGTLKTAQAAAECGVKKFILISTDKAVNPTNIMGASKRLCEMVVQMMDRRTPDTSFVAVRFGNVLGSNGSVIPLFKKQIAEGGPVTVTDKRIVRYFMTIPEAVSLVLQASYYARGGEIFVLDMGDPVKIDDMARNLIRLSGYTPDVDIKVQYVGLRPGEKLYEELLMSEEGLRDTANKQIHIGKPIEMDDDWFLEKLNELDEASRHESDNIRALVSEIVPTYHYEKSGSEVNR